MRQYSFSGKNKGRMDSALEFPKFVLDKKGQKARIALFSVGEKDGKKTLVEPRPEGGYFFDLFNPLSSDGNNYAGSFECLASEETKEAEEFDAGACPHCEFVAAGIGVGNNAIIGPRRRKFVMPIVVYRTNLSGVLLEPFSVEIKAWKFTDRYFNIITDEHEKWNLLEHDLTLTCDIPQFHTYTISVEPDCAFLVDKERTVHAMQTYASAIKMLPRGLIRQAGSCLQPEDLRARIQRVLDMNDGAFSAPGGQASVSSPTEASTLDEVLGAVSKEEDEPKLSVGSGSDVDFDSFFSDE